MMEQVVDLGIVMPLANEAADFSALMEKLSKVLDHLETGKVYLVVDKASKDNTLELCKQLGASDPRFVTVFEAENRHVVDAYLRGYREAYQQGHEFILEMDAGLSHDPDSIPNFIEAYRSGYECVFGSRFMKEGAMIDSSFKRRLLSKVGTWTANLLLGTQLKDMTSGYQGFKREIVKQVLDHGLLSQAHFYQTEVRYLLRKKKYLEIPIVYRAPSPSVSGAAITDSMKVLLYYFFKRLRFNPKIIR